MTRLKQQVGNGKVAVYTRADFDYMQLNTPSVYGIRFADGYETITPQRIAPAPAVDWNPVRYAEAGISHILVAPERDPGGIAGWEKVLQLDEFVLYKNPAFSGLVHAELASGANLALQPTFETPNRREFELPAGAKALTLLESFNPGWKFSFDGKSWHPVQATGIYGMRVPVASPAPDDRTRLLLQYNPAYQTLYRSIIGFVAAALFAFEIFRRTRKLGQRNYSPP